MTDEKDAYFDSITESADWLAERADIQPEIAMILGSGLGALAEELEDAQAFDYHDIPGFPVSAVEGHAGELVFGRLSGKDVVVMSGRVHYYEGWTMKEVCFPTRVFAMMGIETLLVTNSAGGSNPDFVPGDLMLITDHLNLTGENPLRGENDERLGPRFPDMTEAYTGEVRQTILRAATDLSLDIRQGVYAGMAGPTYETPAEIRMVQTIGGDAVGMSTVPEVIAANHSGMRVGGVSCITNFAAGLGEDKLDHAEVKEVATRVREKFSSLVRKTVELL
ncbi:MAG: purine-nucleoside phosphorylase [Myxococcota bacterium]